jgi:hypothetical protein
MHRSKTPKAGSAVEQGANGLIADVLSIVLIGLVLLGIAGALYKALAPDGWLSSVLDRIWSVNPWLVWLVGFGSAATLASLRWCLEGRPAGRRSGEALVYTFLALGLFFFFKLLVIGSL